MIAVGLRPSYGGIPGAKECCFSSDDLFSMKDLTGPVLVIGGSYVALECAGFLHSLGKDVTVMVRSVFLRGFDVEMSNLVAASMERIGIKFISQAVPERFEKSTTKDGVIIYYVQDEVHKIAEFGKVLLAIGRYAVTEALHLERAGVLLNPKNCKVIVDHFDRSNVPNIWAVGDASDVRLELTPVAIQAGVLLAKRLFACGHTPMDYALVPTTVFTPLEYGCVGYSEEQAIKLYGQVDIEVYHSNFTPLEWNFAEKRRGHQAYAKLICVKSLAERVVGVHFLGPHAGEVIQGFAVALKTGATKAMFDLTVGIHPTCAEVFTNMRVTKASGRRAETSDDEDN